VPAFFDLAGHVKQDLDAGCGIGRVRGDGPRDVLVLGEEGGGDQKQKS
jgi:hypothetical protein